MNNWFITWNRPEYKEWATEIPGGYLLVIIRKENKDYLCVKAKLLMGESGLPGFEVAEEHRLTTLKKASEQISAWKKN